jgi:hypothetical protein
MGRITPAKGRERTIVYHRGGGFVQTHYFVGRCSLAEISDDEPLSIELDQIGEEAERRTESMNAPYTKKTYLYISDKLT